MVFFGGRCIVWRIIGAQDAAGLRTKMEKCTWNASGSTALVIDFN